MALVVRSSAAHGVDQLIGERYAGVDAVVGPHDLSIRAVDVAAIERLPQVDTVNAISTAFVQTTWPGDVRPSYLQVQAGLPVVRIANGRLPTAVTELALPIRPADKHQMTVGFALTVHTGRDRLVKVTVVGTVDDSRSIGSGSAIAILAAVRRDPDRRRVRRDTEATRCLGQQIAKIRAPGADRSGVGRPRGLRIHRAASTCSARSSACSPPTRCSSWHW